MAHHNHRGILRAYANVDPNAVIKDLTDAFATFKARHKDETNDLRAAVDEIAARMVVQQMSGGGGPISRSEDIAHANAFANWLRSPQDRTAMGDLAAAEAAAKGIRPQAAGTTLTGSAGGFTVPEPVANRIHERVLEISPMRRLATSVTVTSTGTKFLVNRNDATSSWVGETDARADTTEPTVDLRAPSYGTVFGYVEATEELLLDSAVDIRGWFVNSVAQQIANAEGAAFVAGDGTNKPTGFLAGPAPLATSDATRVSGTLQYVPSYPSPAVCPKKNIH